MSWHGCPWMVFVVLLFTSPIFAAEPNRTLTILHTNDLLTVPSDLRIVPVQQPVQAKDHPRLACLHFPFFEHAPCFFIPSHTPYK